MGSVDPWERESQPFSDFFKKQTHVDDVISGLEGVMGERDLTLSSGL